MGNTRFQAEEIFCPHRVDKHTLHYLHILCFFSLQLRKTKAINCLYSVNRESLFSEPYRASGVFLLGSLDWNLIVPCHILHINHTALFSLQCVLQDDMIDVTQCDGSKRSIRHYRKFQNLRPIGHGSSVWIIWYGVEFRRTI